MSKINTLFFDLGDTFRIIRKDPEFSRKARTRICELIGETERDPDEFYKSVIEPRYDVYRAWALKFMCEAPEEMLWTRWLAFDYDQELLKKNASELCYEYRKSKGERVVTEGGIETARELVKRGYTLAIVSDLVGTHEVDEWLDRDGRETGIDVMERLLTELAEAALKETGADPSRVCFVGDNLNRDIVGAKAAGLGMTVGVQYPNKKPQEVTDENRPDRFIHHFTELLDIFPELDKEDRLE